MKVLLHVFGYIKFLSMILILLFSILTLGHILSLSTSGSWSIDNVIQFDQLWVYNRPIPLLLFFITTAYISSIIERSLEHRLKA